MRRQRLFVPILYYEQLKFFHVTNNVDMYFGEKSALMTPSSLPKVPDSTGSDRQYASQLISESATQEVT